MIVRVRSWSDTVSKLPPKTPGRFEDDARQHLSAGGAEGAQQGELAGALCHEHRERVEDDEDGDENGDEGEDEQQDVEELQL
jgi:hypothetical protein